jgi:non-canonical (house-cleaning) NTP pyrophosphatase
VPSGVPDQPWGDAETRQGALARALGCHAAHAAAHAAPDFAVGLEGGIEELSLGSAHATVPGVPASVVNCFAFMAVMAGTADAPRWGIARTATFPLPVRPPPVERTGRPVSSATCPRLPRPRRDSQPKIVSLIKGEGGQPPMELGDADDAVFSTVNSKQKGGSARANPFTPSAAAPAARARRCPRPAWLHPRSVAPARCAHSARSAPLPRSTAAVGKLTHGAIDRTAYYEHALALALVPFLHDEAELFAPPPPPR